MALVAARDRSAKADVAVAAIRRALTPGHLGDPLTEGGSSFTLDGLRAEYSDMQRRAAGYRATLGDHHPTLAATTLRLAELQGQITEETRRALSVAEREAVQAHAAQRLVERAAAAGARSVDDTTGSIAAAIPAPASAPSAAARPVRRATARPLRDGSRQVARVQEPRPQESSPQEDSIQEASVHDAAAQDVLAGEVPHADEATFGVLGRRAVAPAGVLLVVTAALWGAVSRTRRVPPVPARCGRPNQRREPPWVAPPTSAALTSLPDVVARPPTPRSEPTPLAMPVAGGGAPRDVAIAMAQAPDGPFARAAASLLVTLAADHGDAGRMSVLVLRSGDVPADQGDGVALALAIAAAAGGRRVALMEARPAGRLRRATVPAGTDPMLIAAGGTARTAYRVADGGAVVIVLPSDAGEAEAAAEAARRDATLRLDGLDVFDLVVLVGDQAAALSRAADLVLVVAGPHTAADTIATVVEPCRTTGRTCRTLTLDPVPAVSGQAAPHVDLARAEPLGSVTRALDAANPPALRGTFGPEPERLVA